MRHRHICICALTASLTALTACDDYLDEMPDNRTTLDTGDKVVDLLTTAYPTTSNLIVNEFMSDNTDYLGDASSYGDRQMDNWFFWRDDIELSNDSPERQYMEYYDNVGKANQALEAIDQMGGATTQQLRNARGEALLLRAYNHFLLVGQFCMAYNGRSAQTDMGLYYSKRVERLDAAAPRGTMAEAYANIAADIEEGIPLINDSYAVPKYHFNRRAAYAFATRFYLYHERWSDAERYASLLLGASPSSHLRNYAELEAMPSSTADQSNTVAEQYCNVDRDCNLLVEASTSSAGYILGAWFMGKRYNHSSNIAINETLNTQGPWGAAGLWRWQPFSASTGIYRFVFHRKIPYEMEYTDPVAGYGYYHALNVAFSADEALLNRAEAYVMLGRNAEAAADLDTWMKNYFNTSETLTPESIQSYFNGIGYAYSDASPMAGTKRKHLRPNFDIGAEGGVQESMLQCVLLFRRLETIHQGLRWQDIKRYNIRIPRRLLGSDGEPVRILDWLEPNDPRMALQIPLPARTAGVTPNPRND